MARIQVRPRHARINESAMKCADLRFPYDITLVGVGDDPGPLKIVEDETELKLMSPQGEEGLRAGTPQTHFRQL
jgi:hypothetical protein